MAKYQGLADRLARVRETIALHQHRAGLEHPVRIIGVTKGHGAEAVRAAQEVGLQDVGENRVQEARDKMEQLTDLSVTWHLIGSLQRNKAKQAVGRFGLIHSVDRVELATELARRVPEGAVQAVLIEVNCSGEAQKGGAAPDSVPALADAIVAASGLRLMGLMTMAELTLQVDLVRAAFRRLRECRDRLRAHGHDAPELSMGMSGDYPIAVEEGATMVRLGTLLFGERIQ